jgi:predicted SAM-dependent methyltransferase
VPEREQATEESQGRWIEFGAGERPSPGYLHCDLRALPHVELVADVGRPLPLRDESLAKIRAAHVLEHFSWRDTVSILREWRRVLGPGGTIELVMPNLRWLCDKYVNRDDYSRFSRYTIQSDLFGRQDYAENVHKTAFDWATLCHALTEAGFSQIADLSAPDARHDAERVLRALAVKPSAPGGSPGARG